MKKILIIFGTRPEAIKLAPVIDQLRVKRKKVKPVVCVTSQHRDMLDQALSLFEIRPDYDLNIMEDNQSLFDVTIIGLRKLENILKKEKPYIILVQGDTSTTLTASLAAYYLKIKIGHIEAGLRTRDKFNPFPEEINRRLTDCLADLYFAPTKKAKENLIKEDIPEEKIFITGNTIIDTLLTTIGKQKDKRVQENLTHILKSKYGISLDNGKIILVTGHRRESFGGDIESICQGLKKIVQNNHDVQIIYPVHLNPNVQQPVKNMLGNIEGIDLIEPLDYFSFVFLMNNSYLILTYSSGIQEEAPSLGKPVLVLRKTTERPEGIEAGTAKLVGTESERIFSETTKLLKNKELYQGMARAVNPYGDGRASERIYEILERFMWNYNKVRGND
jgi:UDP-N-acetylglucosamine 2-epimerase (non-hydrolysing)